MHETVGRWVKVYQDLNELLHLKTFPIAVKFFESSEEKPMGLLRPKEPLNVCQVTSLVRYYGRSMYITAEDMACVIGAVSLGMLPMPESMKNGKIAAMLHKDINSARRFTELAPKIEFNKVKMVVCTPLDKTKFDPDQIIIYGNTAQVMRIIQGYLWDKGGRVEFSTGGEWSLCSDVMAQCYNTNDLSLGIPCFGDRKFGIALDDELTVGIPVSIIDEVIEGIKNTHNVSAYPIPFQVDKMPSMPNYTLTEYAIKRKTKQG